MSNNKVNVIDKIMFQNNKKHSTGNQKDFVSQFIVDVRNLKRTIDTKNISISTTTLEENGDDQI